MENPFDSPKLFYAPDNIDSDEPRINLAFKRIEKGYVHTDTISSGFFTLVYVKITLTKCEFPYVYVDSTQIERFKELYFGGM